MADVNSSDDDSNAVAVAAAGDAGVAVQHESADGVCVDRSPRPTVRSERAERRREERRPE